jgi:hypothetical protein
LFRGGFHVRLKVHRIEGLESDHLWVRSYLQVINSVTRVHYQKKSNRICLFINATKDEFIELIC